MNGHGSFAADEAAAASHAGHGCSADPTKREQSSENSERPMTASELLQEAARLESMIASMKSSAAEQIRAAELARRPKMPNCSDGPQFVTWTKFQSGREYAFAAVGWHVPESRGLARAGRTYWAVTGEDTGRHNWSALLSIIGEENWSSLHVVDGQTRIGPDPDDEPPITLNMGTFGRVHGVRIASALLMSQPQPHYRPVDGDQDRW